MKKRTISLLLAVMMAVGALAGCGGGSSTPAAQEPAAEAPAAEAEAPAGEAAAPAADPSKVINVYCWNDEFPVLMRDHYPGYVVSDGADAAKGGMIGDYAVRYIVTDNKNDMYRSQLDEALARQKSAETGDKVDLFLIEGDYALRYVDADRNAAIPLEDLGITEEDLSGQFPYTREVVTDANGKIRGSSWQTCAGGLIFNRAIATEVLGSDDPDEVQAAVADWDKFYETAQQMKEAGYKITASSDDLFRVYSGIMAGKWVQDGKIVVDDSLREWVDNTMALIEEDMTTTNERWSPEWSKGFQVPGDVFCYFGPAEMINSSMGAAPDQDDDGSIAHAGGWGLAAGPQASSWGGTWICAAQGTDNADIVRDIILNLTTNEEVMKSIAVEDAVCVNNTAILEDLAADGSLGNPVLGGQNPYPVLKENAEGISMTDISEYDQTCVEEFRKAMKDYFDGSATYEDALEKFMKAVGDKYPELTW